VVLPSSFGDLAKQFIPVVLSALLVLDLVAVGQVWVLLGRASCNIHLARHNPIFTERATLAWESQLGEYFLGKGTAWAVIVANFLQFALTSTAIAARRLITFGERFPPPHKFVSSVTSRTPYARVELLSFPREVTL
jgi:hypothetical protein